MNGLVRLALTPLLFAASSSLCLATQPYAVWTESSTTLVRSGPADSYYGVQELPKGTQLEVHQELPGGWLAIRPPEGSFSLVSATAVESVDYRTGRITRDQAASRIGSLLTDERDAVHVRLNLGELVEVLDATPVSNNTWIRIAPPAGEFRWVREADVSRSPVVAEAIATAAAEGSWRERDDRASVSVASEGEVVKIRYDEGTQQDPGPAPQVVEAEAPSSASPATPPSATPPTSAATAPPNPSTSPAGASFEQQIDWLEIQLSRRLVGPPNLWVFDDLEREAAALLSRATTPEQTATLRALGERMSRFRATAVRFQSMQSSGNLDPRGVAATPRAPQGQYDAVGILRPVVSKVGNAPPYALVDDRGEVITFVTPSPSINMQQYLGQRVGVSGTRSYLPNYRRRNIQTARVEPTQSPMVR